VHTPNLTGISRQPALGCSRRVASCTVEGYSPAGTAASSPTPARERMRATVRRDVLTGSVNGSAGSRASSTVKAPRLESYAYQASAEHHGGRRLKCLILIRRVPGSPPGSRSGVEVARVPPLIGSSRRPIKSLCRSASRVVTGGLCRGELSEVTRRSTTRNWNTIATIARVLHNDLPE
jgi:hypothetical protein